MNSNKIYEEYCVEFFKQLFREYFESISKKFQQIFGDWESYVTIWVRNNFINIKIKDDFENRMRKKFSFAVKNDFQNFMENDEDEYFKFIKGERIRYPSRVYEIAFGNNITNVYENITIWKTKMNAYFPSEVKNRGDIGIDIRNPIDLEILPMKDVLINTGLVFKIPQGFALDVKNKSGISTKKKLIKGAQLIDPSYRGNVHVHLFNFSEENVKIKRGDEITQFIIYPILDLNNRSKFKEVHSYIEQTNRGDGGFGSTGE